MRRVCVWCTGGKVNSKKNCGTDADPCSCFDGNVVSDCQACGGTGIEELTEVQPQPPRARTADELDRDGFHAAARRLRGEPAHEPKPSEQG